MAGQPQEDFEPETDVHAVHAAWRSRGDDGRR